MIVLFAALIVPWFVNWDSYTANFEREATRLVGHPVHVGGAARVRILPSPSVTFTDVEVGEPGADPIVTIENFAATIELVPLLQGEVRVQSMTLERPHIRVTADDLAAVNWLKPPGDSKGDPNRVVLGSVQINDGTLNYVDAETGIALAFGGVTATVAADSLAGPWRLEGTYLDGARAVPFRFATGRQLDDGTIRVQSTLTPTLAPLSVSADGVLANDAAKGFTYAGTYNVAEVAGDKTLPAGWRSQGTFALSRDRVAIDKAVLSTGPVERPTSVAGSLTVAFGKNPSFSASAEARQLDLDRTLAGGPSEPVNVAATAQDFLARVAALPVPTIPGRIAFNVPGIVVGGAVVQDVAFVAEPAPEGWKLSGLTAHLPGQALVEADGVLSVRKALAFAGHARLAVAQPTVFAGWWRGAAQSGAGGPLPAFDIAGDATLAAGRVSVDKASATIGDATIAGRFSWGDVKGVRVLSTDLKANRINYAQVKSLAGLLTGRDLADVGSLADSFSVRLAADSFQYTDIVMQNVAIDASYANDTLNVVQLAVGDVGGASLRVSSGRIDELRTNPHGHLDAHLEADTLDGLTVIAGKLLPGSAVSDWLAHNAPSLAPAVVNARITAPPKNGAGFQVAVDGVSGSTTFSATVQSATNLNQAKAWRAAPAVFAVSADSPDSAALAHQLGFAASAANGDGGAHISAKGAGVPKDGLDSVIDAEFAGIKASGQGKLVLDEPAPTFNGTFSVDADDLATAVATAGLGIPGAAPGTPVALEGSAAYSGGQVTLTWKDGKVADRAVSGSFQIARSTDQNWRVGGDLQVDAVDLGWLASLSLGFAPELSDNAKMLWSKTTFAPPTYGPVSGKIAVATQHLAVGNLDITGGAIALALQPNRIDVDLTGGHLAGGAAAGGVSIQNVDGNATLTGQFNLTGAALDGLAWRRDDKPVITGGLDLSANFEATGKSPAALVASMTGGGVIALHNGIANNINPETVRSIVRLSDLGEPFSDAALQDAVASHIDTASLPFGETGAAFTIAGGTVRLSGMTARGADVKATGNASIDLSALTLTSEWTLDFNSAEPLAGGAAAKINLAFHGPLAAPVRSLDALPFNSYLSTRQAARMLDVIATEEADHAEHDRLQQQIVKIRDDTARAERQRQEAIDAARRKAEAAASAIAKTAALHIDREIDADARTVAMLQRAADLAAAAAVSAQSAATDAGARAASLRAKANDAQATLAISVTADADAAAAAIKAAADLTAAQAKAAATAETAATAATVADAAEKAASAAVETEAAAKAAAAKADSERNTIAGALDAANSKLSIARNAADGAAADRDRAKATVDDAGNALTDAVKNRDATAQALALAEAALATTRTFASQTAEAARSARQASTDAEAARAQLETAAENASGEQTRAETALVDARAAVDSNRQKDAAAQADLTAAQANASTDGGLQAAAKRSNADNARQMLNIAESQLNAAEADVSAATTKAAMARAALDVATGRATDLAVLATQADVNNESAQAQLEQKISARDTAATNAESAAAWALRAGAAFTAAQSASDDADQRATKLAAAADAAVAEQTTATKANAVSGAAPAAFALEDASKARAEAVAEAGAARATANAAKADADAAASALTAIVAVHEAAISVADAAHAARLANEKAAQSAQAEAISAESAAAAAAATAAARKAEADAAALRLQPAAASPPAKPVAVPSPRPRPKPITLAPDAMAGEPMSLTPAE